MVASMEKQAKQEKDIRILETFIGCYCRSKHKSPKGVLCEECSELLAYAKLKREKCPLDPKPTCKHCRVHCYGKVQRAKVREIMAYSGKHLILRGRLDLLWHYFF
ncbi:nitrous oxide-stimulated promoter family protein [Geomonas sp. Red421]|uniref:Nitrous oxide-stimulated promoter family protein n=2 Tax=Geomonas anaerohicana TaxID=2798583 RepID=A0ABS0YA58_9BACT|nr:nitrous oxide-stimulated promoter family protein [Geomonas anaerohicana]